MRNAKQEEVEGDEEEVEEEMEQEDIMMELTVNSVWRPW